MNIKGFPLVYPMGESYAGVQEQIDSLKSQVRALQQGKADLQDYTDDGKDNPTVKVEQSALYLEEV